MKNNPWVAQQREQAFRPELGDPAVWIEVAGMLLSEGEYVPTFESLLNRISYVRSHGQAASIHSMLHSGFYGPINRGELPSFIARIRRDKNLVNALNTAIETVVAGSDQIEGYTDQGLPTDPNGGRHPQLRIGGNIYNDWGGGPLGHAGAEAWRQAFEHAATAIVTLPSTPPPKEPPQVTTPAPIAAPASTTFVDPIPAIQAGLMAIQPLLPVLAPLAGPGAPLVLGAVPVIEGLLQLFEDIKNGNGLIAIQRGQTVLSQIENLIKPKV